MLKYLLENGADVVLAEPRMMDTLRCMSLPRKTAQNVFQCYLLIALMQAELRILEELRCMSLHLRTTNNVYLS